MFVKERDTEQSESIKCVCVCVCVCVCAVSNAAPQRKKQRHGTLVHLLTGGNQKSEEQDKDIKVWYVSYEARAYGI